MDIKLSYTEKGKGFPLVLLHGNGESGEYFSSQTDYFSNKYRVIAVDTRGHGKSPRGSSPFTLGQFARDLLDFLDGMNIEKTNLLGFSDGGNIALIFALSHPERVEKLILNGANLYPSGMKLPIQVSVVSEWLFRCAASVFNKNQIPKREMLALMAKEPHIKPKALAALGMSALVIVGTRDMIKDSHSSLIADSIPRARFCRINGSHFIAAENSGEFNKAVSEFLEEN